MRKVWITALTHDEAPTHTLMTPSPPTGWAWTGTFGPTI
jgi:hypothetical protein